jgi:threonine aldolase
LSEDHTKAKKIGEILTTKSWVKKVLPVETNIVIFETEDSATTSEMLAQKGIRCSPFSPTLVRMVTHLDFSDEMMEAFEKRI